MLDVGTYIRQGWYEALSNILQCDIFDEFNVTAAPSNPYVVLSTQTEQQNENDGPFLYNCTIIIKVVSYGSMVIGKKSAEIVGNQILGLITDARTQPFTMSAPLTLIETKLVSTNTMPMDAKDKVYITKLYRFFQIVSQ